ncbi:MAG: hypothetical protein OSJ70_07950 [Bacilli bacterium]|nr:hypothetical protein [Bacilli bacterium]
MKIIKKLSLLSIMLLALITNTSAQEALSIGTDFGKGLDSSGEAIYAGNSYASLGYHSFIDIVPTVSSLESDIKQYNTSKNTSGAFFFHGHGAKEYIGWDYLGKGNNYSTGFIQDGVGTITNYKKISSLNLNKTKIGIFMGCNTAQTTNNISKYAQTKGVKVTTGWVYEIIEGETDKWNEAFFSKLKSGKTFRDSYKYANSLSYTHNENMKTHRVYGDATVKGTATTTNAAAANVLYENMDIDNRKKLTISIKNKNDIKTLITQNIKNNFDENFNENDYEMEVSESPDGTIYDFNYMLDGAKTEHGYTALVENNTIELYDNMDDFKNKIISNYRTEYSKTNATDLDNTKVINEYAEEILKKYKEQYKDYVVSLHSTKKTYDDNEKRIVLNLYIKVTHKETGATSIYREIL